MMQTVKLGTICKMQSGGTPRRGTDLYYKGGTIPWAKIGDIENAQNGWIYETEEKITELGLESINNRIFPKGTLFFAMYGSVGKTSLAGTMMSSNQAILGIQPNKNILDVKYLNYWLKSKIKDFENQSRGVALKNLSATIMKNQSIPLPPLETQKKIAAILDKADELRQNDLKILEKYDQLAQSVFLEMFGDPVLNPKDWSIVTLGDISKKITKGESPHWQGFGYLSEGVRFITSENVRLGYLNTLNSKFISEKFHSKLIRSQLKPYDILVNLVGASIGRGAIVTPDILPANINQAVAKIELNPLLVIPRFILCQIITPQIQGSLIGNKVEGARANISLKDVADLQIVNPPIEVQQKFCEIINKIDKQKSIGKESCNQSEDLFQSLLQRAFMGKL
jgi:type I restriction enzyme S subunit